MKRIPASGERAEKSIRIAEKYLSEAKQTLEIETYNLVIIASYTSVFHSARAILFNDGIAERSHFAIYEYMKAKHSAFGDGMLNSFDLYRKLRHSVAYGLDTDVGKEDAEKIIEFASDFLEKTKQYFISRKRG